jgi:hypothetical protein
MCSGTLDSDSGSSRSRFATDLPQIDGCRELVLLPRRPFHPPPAKSCTCLARLLSSLATSPIRRDASLLRLGQESRRDLTRPDERAAFRAGAAAAVPARWTPARCPSSGRLRSRIAPAQSQLHAAQTWIAAAQTRPAPQVQQRNPQTRAPKASRAHWLFRGGPRPPAASAARSCLELSRGP